MADDPQDLLRLADEVAADSRSDNIDSRIAIAIGWQPPMLPGICGPNYSGRSRYEWHNQAGQTRGFHPPRFTTSLDAARTVVPSDHDVQLTIGWGEPTEAVVAHHLAARNGHIATAATPALALCAAALRAKAASC